jgi:hypothetical protein
MDPGEGRIGPFVVGAFYGTVVLGLIRLFPIARWAYPLAGLLAGPVPLALLLRNDDLNADERGGFWLLTTLLGLAIGLLELTRTHPARRAEHASDPESAVE